MNLKLKKRKPIFEYSILLGAFAPALFSPVAAAKTPAQIFAQVSPYLVSVNMVDAQGKPVAQGSGVMIRSAKVITTCDVAGKGKTAQVRRSGKSFKAVLQQAQTERNLCHLDVSKLQSPPIVLGTARKLSIGERIYAVGVPLGKEGKEEGREREPVLKEGTVTGLRFYDGSKYARISTAISSGFSGGGLFDKEGNLIGILSPQVVQGEELTFVLPVDWIDGLGKEKGKARSSPAVSSKSGLHSLNRALALEKKADWRGLLKLSQQEVKRDPANATAWFNVGIASCNLKQYAQAVQAYREAIRNQAEYGEAWHKLGVAYANLKDYDNALQAYEDALRMEPDNADAWYDLGNTYYDLKKYPHAIHAYREALRIYAENPNAWYKLGITYDDLKLYEEAVEAYRETVEIQPENADAWYKLGVDYAVLEERGKMREIYQTLRKLDPARAEQYFNTYILP